MYQIQLDQRDEFRTHLYRLHDNRVTHVCTLDTSQVFSLFNVGGTNETGAAFRAGKLVTAKTKTGEFVQPRTADTGGLAEQIKADLIAANTLLYPSPRGATGE